MIPRIPERPKTVSQSALSTRVSFFFQVWRVQACLWKATRLVTNAKRQENALRYSLLETALDEAWDCRSLTKAWEAARAIAGAAKGSKRKWGQTPLIASATLDEITRRSGMQGFEGGWGNGAIPDTDESMRQKIDTARQVVTDSDAHEKSCEIYGKIRIAVSRAALRRGIPSWEVLVELWDVIFAP